MIKAALEFIRRFREPEAEVLFQDQFQGGDSKDLIPGWLNREKTAQVQSHSLALSNGWVAASKEIPGDVRLEFLVRVLPGQTFNLGAFISGAEGFWSGYELYLVGNRAVIRRSGVIQASDDSCQFKAGQDYSMFLQRAGSQVTAGWEGQTRLECVDLDPLAQDNQSRFGFLAFSTQARFKAVRALRPPSREKGSPMGAADRLFAHRRFESALLQYKASSGVLDDRERETCALKSLLCLHRIGRSREALEKLHALEADKPGPTVTRLLLKLGFELSLAVGDWDGHQSYLGLILSDPAYAAERQAAADILGKAEKVWKRRDLWEGERGVHVLDRLLRTPDMWTHPFTTRALLRFALATGQGARIAEICESALSARNEPTTRGKDLGELHYQRCEALAAFDHRMDLAKLLWEKAKRAFGMEEENWNEDHGMPLFEFEKLWGKDGEGLRREFLGLIGGPDKMRLAYAFLRAAEFAWSRGQAAGREFYSGILDRLPLHGTAMCSSLAATAAMDLWDGDAPAAEAHLRRIAAEYPGEVWAAPIARLVLGRVTTAEYRKDLDRDKIWTEGPRRATPFLVVAAWFRRNGQEPAAVETLEMIQGVSFPWEPAAAIAGAWLAELKGMVQHAKPH